MITRVPESLLISDHFCPPTLTPRRDACAPVCAPDDALGREGKLRLRKNEEPGWLKDREVGVCPGLPIAVHCWTGSQPDLSCVWLARAFSSAPGSHLQSDGAGMMTSVGWHMCKSAYPGDGDGDGDSGTRFRFGRATSPLLW